MKYVYFNFLTCWFVLLIFYCVSALFCLRIQNRSKAAFHLGVMYIFCGAIAFGYFLSGVIYHPVAAIHRYFIIFFMNIVQAHAAQFFLCFPNDDTPRFRRGLLISEYVIIFFITVLFIIKSVTAGYVFHFDGHYWDFQLNEFSKLVGYIVMIMLFVTVIIGCYRAALYRKKEGFWIFIMTILYLVLSLVPGIINILSRDGAIGRDIYVISMLFMNLIGFAGIFIIFTNFTKDRTTLMSKIVTLSMVTCFFLMLCVMYYSSVINERTYDAINKI